MRTIEEQTMQSHSEESLDASKLSTLQIAGFCIAILVFLAGFAYLVAIPLGAVGSNRLSLAEAAIFCAMLLFAVIFATGLEKISFSTNGLELVRRVEQKQIKQAREIETLRFLVNYFVTDRELDHLRRIAREVNAPYGPLDSWHLNILRNELRRIRSLGLIESLPNQRIGDMPSKGDLMMGFRLTERGRQYLALRGEAASSSAVTSHSAPTLQAD